MPNCPRCQTPCDHDDLFCPECGAALSPAATCPRCGEAADPEDRFCFRCGTALPQAAQSNDAPIQPGF